MERFFASDLAWTAALVAYLWLTYIVTRAPAGRR